MTTTAQEIACPKCGGRMWDNRATKTNPKAPDYKCRDRACDGAVWPPKNTPAANNAKAPQSAGGPNAGLDVPEGLDQQFAVYDVCLAHAHAAAVKRFGADVTDTAVAAMAATLYIQALKVRA